MATAGTDYVLATDGLKWPDPSRITYSVAPDGVWWGHGTNTLNSYLNSTIGTNGSWQRAIARALATWESVANINIVQVADGPYDEDARGLIQGDPRFGDIRFGAYSFHTSSGGLDQTTLAQTAFPPPQSSTLAGDVQINTNFSFHTDGASFDLYSVLLHETGHSLGLNHPPNAAEVMYASYEGVRSGLSAGDIAGIQSIYGPRRLDVYQSYGLGLNQATAIDLTSAIASAGQTTTSWTSLAKIGDVEWFSFVAPAYASGVWQATASAADISLLSPKITVYDAAGNSLGQASNPSAWGNSVTVSPQGVVPGARYYIAVTGATNDYFDAGAYQLSVHLSTSPPPPPPPVVAPPVTAPITVPVVVAPQVLIPPTGVSTNTIAPDRFEPNNTPGTATPLGRIGQGTVYGANLNTAADVDCYSFQAAAAGVVEISAAGTYVQVLNSRGSVLAQGSGVVEVSASRNATLVVRVQSADSAPVASYTLSITPKPPARQVGFVQVKGRPAARPAARPVFPHSARGAARFGPRVAARPAARVQTRPAGRITARPPWRLARLETSATPVHAMLGAPDGWRSLLKTTWAG